VTALSFDASIVHSPADPSTHIPNHPLKVAYGPYLTKCGSSSARKMLKYVTDYAPLIIITENLTTTQQEMILDQYTFFTFLRHPMDRALAGFHQMEVFIRMAYTPLNSLIEKYDLTWWNDTCIAESWGDPSKRKYVCTGSNKDHPLMTSTERKLQRLNAFLDDISTKGFVDQHITPLTYLMATSPVVHAKHFLVFDLKQADDMNRILSEAVGKPAHLKKIMARHRQNFDWVIGWTDLVAWAGDDDDDDDDEQTASIVVKLAKRAIEKLCQLYRQDVECLPYDVPECNGKDNVLHGIT
jgi:hypothetical protein